MASINGVELKNVKTFRGHDGPGYYQGTVYFNGKKLGSWSQDAWCGPDLMDFDETILYPVVNYLRNTSLVEPMYKDIYDVSCLIGDVLELKLAETQFKQAQKKGAVAMCAVEINGMGYEISTTDKRALINIEEAKKIFMPHINKILDKYKAKNVRCNIDKFEVYFNLDSFNKKY